MAILARPNFLTPVEVRDASRADRRPAPFGVVGAEPQDAISDVREREGHDEREKITALYVEHGARIHRFLRDLLGDAALAADATQETFVRAYRKLSNLGDGETNPTSFLAPWIFGIARNVSLEVRKSRFRAHRHLVPVHGALPDVPSPASSPEADALGREALRVVSRALDKLPEERRAMLLLRLDHGLSYDDIALTMGCSLARVKVEIFRARETLRATMADYEQA